MEFDEILRQAAHRHDGLDLFTIEWELARAIFALYNRRPTEEEKIEVFHSLIARLSTERTWDMYDNIDALQE